MILQLWLALCVLTPIPNQASATTQDPVAEYRAAAIARWEEEIQALEKLDRETPDPERAVLFLGSSSIRRWDTIAQDMAPYPVIQRGYGGAKFSDLAVFIDRLVRPHNFQAAVVFVGNDITGNKDDKSVEEVLRLIKIIIAKIGEHKDSAPIFLIAVTPTSSRFAAWEKIKQLNSAMDDYCQKTPGVHFIDTVDRYLDKQGKPIDSYFVADKLHQNQAGYQVWSEIIKSSLGQVLPEPR